MATNVPKLPQNIAPSPNKLRSQTGLRVLLIPTTAAAALLLFSSNENTSVYGVPLQARYSYSSAFTYFGWANVIACTTAVLSLAFHFICTRRSPLSSSHYFFLFLHDLSFVCLELSATAAATAVGFVGKYGIEKAGWLPICGEVGKFCSKVMSSVFLGYLSVLLWFALAIVSAVKSRQIQAIGPVSVAGVGNA